MEILIPVLIIAGFLLFRTKKKKEIYIVKSTSDALMVKAIIENGEKVPSSILREKLELSPDVKHVIVVEGPNQIVEDIAEWMKTDDQVFVTNCNVQIVSITNEQ